MLPDAWASVILFLDCRTAVRVRLVSRTMHEAFDLACYRGPADAAKVRVLTTSWGLNERRCRAVLAAAGGVVPLWLRYVRETELLRFLLLDGDTDVCDGLALPPFSLGHEHATIDDNAPLRWAAEHGHVAVLDRLALPPYSLGPEDARSAANRALHSASRKGHVAVLDRLARWPYLLGQEDARSCDNEALHDAARRGHVAVLDRLALPPFSLGQTDARCRNYSLRRVSALEDMLGGCHDPLTLAVIYGRVAVLDRLALPPYSLGHEDAIHTSSGYLPAHTGGAVLERLRLPPYSP